MKFYILCFVLVASIVYAGNIEFSVHDQNLDENFELKDFIVWRTISDIDPSVDWYYFFGALQNTSEWAFKNVDLCSYFYSDGVLVYADTTSVDYYTYQDRGMRPQSIAFTNLHNVFAFEFDYIDFTVIHDGAESGRDLFLLEDALELSDFSLTPYYPGSVYSTIAGTLTNVSFAPLNSPSIFCCVYKNDNLVTINEISSLDLDKKTSPINPGEEIAFTKIVEVPADYDSIRCYTHYSIEGSGLVELPVELSAFTAEKVADHIELHWQTESETNNYGFFVQKLQADGTWYSLGFVAGHQTTTTRHAYSFSDDQIHDGVNHYRLVQIDTDGARTEYPAISVNVQRIPNAFALEQNYPNPFNAETWIRYSIPFDSNVKLHIYNTTGKQVKTLVNEFQNAGMYKVKVDMTDFPSGIYYYTLTTQTEKKSASMLLVK